MVWKTPIAYSIIGILLISFGSVIILFSNDVIENCINKEFVLSKTSKLHGLWVKNGIKVYLNMYFFNWTNPEDANEPDYKPAFQEMGPYAFEETFENVDVIWNENGTVTYKKLRKWFFEPRLSAGTLGDRLTTLNSVAAAGAYVVRRWSSFAKKSMSMALSATQKIYVRKTVEEITFKGYVDPLLAAGNILPGLSNLIPFDRFGYFYGMNGSSEATGVFNVDTGANDAQTLGQLRMWNYKNRTSFYRAPCGDVFGSAGELWPPKRSKTENVVVFSVDLCRYIIFKFTKEVEVGGIKGYRYDPGPEMFDNGTAVPGNECFCGGECVPSGALNVSTCRHGAPGFASFAHFLHADPFYRDSVRGMNPDPLKHDTYIILEPTYGIFLEVAGRFQVNMLVQPDPEISLLQNLRRTFYPIFWLEQKVTIPHQYSIAIKILLAMPTVLSVVSGAAIALGSSLIFTTIVKKARKKNRNRKEGRNGPSNSKSGSKKHEKEVRLMLLKKREQRTEGVVDS